jgi:hypothetical protein
MKASTYRIRAAMVVIAAAGVLSATAALAGGNGNGGSGGGGSHGAATSGMTYHSEPVNSPWNRPFGDAPQARNQSGTETTAAMHRDADQMSKTQQ